MERTARPAAREGSDAVRRLSPFRATGRAASVAVCVAVCVAAGAPLAGCAAPGMPPGGPVDRSPPVLLAVTPDTGTLNARGREVVFRFDKVVNERPRGAQSLDLIVVVSPSEGPVRVDWRRQAIAVSPRRGWRSNTAYTVTILPGLSDLHGNSTTKPLHTQFSTGTVIPRGVVRGVVFDWVAQRIANGARIEAIIGADTMLRYVTAADSAGRYVLPGLPAGDLYVRAFSDQNGNRTLERWREPWDSTHVALADSARFDFYVFQHDSVVGPRPSSVTAADSVTVRVKFDRPLLPGAPLDTSSFVLRRASDSARMSVRRALNAAAYDSLAATRKRLAADSAAAADTTAAGRVARAKADSLRAAAVRDSISRAQIEAIRAARDTVKAEPLPKPARPAPLAEYVLELATPLAPATPMRLEVRGATGLSGVVRTVPSQVLFSLKKAEPKDSSATKPVPPRRP